MFMEGVGVWKGASSAGGLCCFATSAIGYAEFCVVRWPQRICDKRRHREPPYTTVFERSLRRYDAASLSIDAVSTMSGQ